VQLNTLNRVIALFLIGGLVTVLAATALEKQILPTLERYSKMGLGPSAGIFLAVALLSITALAGSVTDALGNITVRRLISRALAKRRLLAVLFFCGVDFDAQDSWRTAFKDALDGDTRFKASVQKDEMIKALSAGFFFRTAEKEHTEWLVQHHSMYHLSANFVIILIACAIWSFLHAGFCYLAFGSILGAYLLTSFALDNYLYTYQLSFRNAYLALTDVRDVKPDEGKAQATRC
jgi:uncharacterized membrane protein YraQ (UPF0718 family)